jgi:type IV pilus assembly protein PilQ
MLKKGAIMESLTRSKRLGLLALMALVMLACSAAVAEDAGEETAEVRTTLEQRMQKPISVKYSGEDIDLVIEMMAGYADIDIIKSPSVTGPVTATLTEVPLEEALTNILAIHGWGYVKSESMIRILPLEEIREAPESMVSKIYRITYADVKGVQAALKEFISRDGAISSNIGTSDIIITDYESRIQAIDTFIEQIDRITPQILVDARIYDVTSQERLDLGIEWQAGRNTNYGAGGIGDVGTNPTGRRDPFLTGGWEGDTAKTSGVLGVLRLGWLNDSIDIDAMLKAQENVIHAKLLANPRVLVLDNETALFDIVREHPYVERSVSAGTITETVKFKNAGVKLTVTPHITRDGMIRLHILPEFNLFVERVNLSSDSTNVPVIDTRKANTIALVKDRQTVVLGGLRKKDVSKQVNKVPLLGDLPLVGALFKFEGEDTSIAELVVFITPRIVEAPVLTERELRAYEATEFGGPIDDDTRAEKRADELDELEE